MTIIIQSRRRSLANIQADFPDAKIIDVTSKGEQPWVKFSPFYPHGQIPVPFYPHLKSQSVEGVWQGLKIFKTAGIDRAKMQVTDMKNIKRTQRKYGDCLGHKAGDRLLTYLEARKLIYLPTYLWVLENSLATLVGQLQELSQSEPIVLLDYETNGEIENTRKPLSHAWLIKLYIEGNYPN